MRRGWDANMVGDSNGQREDSRPDRPARIARKRVVDPDSRQCSKAIATGSSKGMIAAALRAGRLDQTQAKVLDDLMSRTHLLGFESRKVISVLVSNIAMERTLDKKRELVQQLRDYLGDDELAKDIVPSLSVAFATR